MALVLPLTSRRLWSVHLVAVIAAGLVLLLISTIILLVADRWVVQRLLEREAIFQPGVITLFAHLATGLILAAVFLQGAEPSLHHVPVGRVLLRFSVGLPAILMGMLFLSTLTPALLLLPLGLAALMGWMTYRELPSGFLVESLVLQGRPAAERDPRAAAEEIGPRPPLGNLRYWWMLFTIFWRRCGKKGAFFLPLLSMPILLLFGVFLSGLFATAFDPDLDKILYPSIAMAWYILLTLAWAPARNLRFVDPLPVSRNSVFATLVLPAVVMILAGYGGGRLGTTLLGTTLFRTTLFGTPAERITFEEVDSHYYVLIPWGECEITWDGSRPRVSSPWGESHQVATVVTPFRGSRAALYSPFSTPEGSSLDFVALQISRAVEAVYGGSIPPEEIRDHYLRVDGAGEVVPMRAGLTLLADYPELRSRGAGLEFPLLMILVFVPWLLLVTVLLQFLRAGTSVRRQQVMIWVFMGFCLALYLGSMFADIFGLMDMDAVVGFIEIGLRNMRDSVPGMSLALYVLAVAAGLGSYWLAQNRFNKIEVLKAS